MGIAASQLMQKGVEAVPDKNRVLVKHLPEVTHRNLFAFSTTRLIQIWLRRPVVVPPIALV